MTPPPQMECSHPECPYETPPNVPSYELVIRTLELHISAAHSTRQTSAAPIRTEKPKRPALTCGLSETDWVFFQSKWDRYVRLTQISGQTLLDELWSCMDEDLEKLAFNDGIKCTSVETLLSRIKSLSVTTLHPSMHIVALHEMKQSPEETSKAFSARVRGTAANCGLQKTCPKPTCGEMVSYLEETCYHVVIAGLNDPDLKDKVLTQAMLGSVKDLPSLLNFTAAEESAKLKLKADINAISNNQKSPNRKCNWCGMPVHGRQNQDREKLCKAFNKKCNKCQKLHHFANCCRSGTGRQVRTPNTTQAAIEPEENPEVSGFIAAINAQEKLSCVQDAEVALVNARKHTNGPVNSLPVPHYLYDKEFKQWQQRPPKPSPTITVTAQLDKMAYVELRLNPPKLIKKPGAGYSRARRATADTGAQLTVINARELQALGIKKETIFPLATNVNTVTRSNIDLIGGVFLKFMASSSVTGSNHQTRQLCYVSNTVPGIYLSEQACTDLGCVSSSFPTVGQCNSLEVTESGDECSNLGVQKNQDCNCPKRTLPPSKIPDLPYSPTRENLPKLKEFILNYYASSAFNTCEHQPLPMMETAPPLRLFVDPQATPVAVSTPSSIPLHWVDQVKAGLDRDEMLGVIEKVPVNEPVSWCSRMVITPKHDGTPRRVVDFGQLNKNAPRQTHHTKSPYVIAASIPAGKVKTVLDNWHGYHSVPIHPNDRPLTTFLTPYGRYRYITTPQGFISAGDGYTQRMDMIVAGTKDYEHCVDDSVLWDDSIQENFVRVCEFLEKCSKQGCIFNPKKFQFAEEEVQFLGFNITKTGIKPLQSSLDSIRSFPTPNSITDIRSWFGLVGQVSYAFAAAPIMEPFRTLLSNKLPFHWSPQLQDAFTASKAEIIKQCEAGVRAFSLTKPTVLATDWSKAAVGCWLVQKFCACVSDLPSCCPSGWQTVYVASKFNSPAVANYHPIEGEAFAATWALRKCRIFTLGHPNLKLAIDHKPLLATLGADQDLSTILNPRIMDFKLKSMAYHYTPVHIPGKKHVVPDTLSRRSDSPALELPKPMPADTIITNVDPAYSESCEPPQWVSKPNICSISIDQPEAEELYLGEAMSRIASLQESCIASTQTTAITWERLQTACKSDADYQSLHANISSGLSEDRTSYSEYAKPFYRYRLNLTTLGPVIMLQNRPVIPQSLRMTVLSHLHACHSGPTAMYQRALQEVFWPSYKEDISWYQAQCSDCVKIAPSNPYNVSAEPPSLPDYPFQSVCADFFTYKGKNYLVIVDRYSNWLNIMKLAKDTTDNVISVLRQYFSTYGICEVFSTDGAKVFMSDKLKQFFELWGVTHRVSSAYYARSNKRAEVGVKSAKRLIMNNILPNGSLDSDKFARAVLTHRNTPDVDSKVSPAEIVYGKKLRDHIPRQTYTPRMDWQELSQKRQAAFMKRHYSKCETINIFSKHLQPLSSGDSVYIQAQAGTESGKWTASGRIVEVLPHDSYLVRIDGSNKVTRRNRKFLRKFTPFIQEDKQQAAPAHHSTSSVNAIQPLDMMMDVPLNAVLMMQE